MTLDEIEKELGYKVKIINKEKNNGNGKNVIDAENGTSIIRKIN